MVPGQWRLLILDRHPLFAEAFVALLRNVEEVDRVGGLSSLAELPRLTQSIDPTVVFVDPVCHEAGPIETLRHVKEFCTRAKIIVLDDQIRLSNLKAAVDAGTAGYWTKHSSLRQILSAISTVLAGDQSFCPGALPYLTSTPKGMKLRGTGPAGFWAHLSRREFEVLLYLIRGYTVKECARKMKLAESTVDNHKSRLMRKIGVHRLVDLVRWAGKEGLLT